MVRKRLCFTGSVQGVGFRYRAYHAAQSLGLTGWVQNCWDGSVLMEVQGSEEEIDRLIVTINKGMFVSIDNIDCQTLPLEEGERSFKIRYYE
ncbi:MAG: acylphosphatase [Lachnospiraceae bacterium]|nr:acylphosphatase [Lachnospiraceae bacterium]